MSNPIACNHDDTLLILRPDRTVLRVPVSLVLAMESVLRRCEKAGLLSESWAVIMEQLAKRGKE